MNKDIETLRSWMAAKVSSERGSSDSFGRVRSTDIERMLREYVMSEIDDSGREILERIPGTNISRLERIIKAMETRDGKG